MSYSDNKSVRRYFQEAVPGALLLSIISFLIQWRFGFGWADEGLLWYGSQRAALGQVPLLDFFSYDPGRYYWNSLVFQFLGDSGLFSLLFSCMLFGSLGLAAVWLTMCRAGLPVVWRLACAITLAIVLGYPRHKIFEQSLSLILLCLIFEILLKPGDAKRWVLFGVITGLAAVFGRNHGVFYVLAAILCGLYLVVVGKKSLFWMAVRSFVLGVIVGYLPIILLVILNSGFRKEFVNSILFTAQWQLGLPIPFPWKLNWGQVLTVDQLQSISISLLCVLVPLLYVGGLFNLFLRRASDSKFERVRLMLGSASIAGLPYLHQAFDRADFGHIAQSIAPVVVVVFSLVCLAFNDGKWGRIRGAFALVPVVLILAAWLPSEPALSFGRLINSNPDRIQKFSIAGKEFLVLREQAELLGIVRNSAAKCSLKDGEFLAAPHYPGLYAFLGVKAPFWEMYYLYQRSPEFQKKHIDAISSVQLILISPDATVDYLDRLKLANTYGLLLDHIQNKYRRLSMPGLNPGFVLYAKPGSCADSLDQGALPK